MVEAVSLEEKVRFLSRRESYAPAPARVDRIETHMSWVFLADRDVYKLKKPVLRPYLDFRTIDARRKNADEEVRLNRRLAPDTYRGVLPLALEADGTLALGGAGPPVDWLVHMRRIPAERFLDRALASGTATLADADAVGRALASFYVVAERVPLAPADYVTHLAGELRANAIDLRLAANGVAPHAIDHAEAAVLARLERVRPLLEERARRGRIVDAHGDLRPEHVALESPPVVIDCLEFNADLRILDPLDELAFFVLECRRLGADAFGRAVLAAYERAAGDPAPPELFAFYESFRAILRAKLAAWRIFDPGHRGAPHWKRKVVEYLERCEEIAMAGRQGIAVAR